MAVRPLIRPRPRVTAPAALPTPAFESTEGLPRVLSRVCDCASPEDQVATRAVPRQPTVIKPVVVPLSPVQPATSHVTEKPVAAKPEASKPTLPAFWKSRKVLVAAGIMALVSAVAVGYQFRPKQQVIVVHPAKQPAAVATLPASSNSTTKPAFQPLPPAATPSKETTSTASVMPRATWPPEKAPAAAPIKNPAPPIQTANKAIDTRTSWNNQPAATPTQENLPRMSTQFPQTPNTTSNSPSNAAVVYNPTMNAGPSAVASGYAPQNNQPPQNGMSPQYTAARPNFPQNMQPSQPLPPQDGSFGAYGGARFEGQIQPLPLRR